MGWNIELVRNTVAITSQVALSLYQSNAPVVPSWEEECSFPMLEGIIYAGKLVFNPDHMEHMDYLAQEGIIPILCSHRVTGDICFVSHKGDNKGAAWGYRFYVDNDGRGQCAKLRRAMPARLWTEVKPRSQGKASKKKLQKPELDPTTIRALLDEANKAARRCKRQFDEDDSVESMHAMEAWRGCVGWLQSKLDKG